MTALDFVVNVWAASVEGLLSSIGVHIQASRSPTDRLNASCAVNLRRDPEEAELLLWESGEAELALVNKQGEVVEEHFDSIDADALGVMLARMLEVFK